MRSPGTNPGRRSVLRTIAAMALSLPLAATAAVFDLQGDMRTMEIATPRTPAPVLALTDAEGAPVTFADWRGEVLVVNWWATWCAPCVHELPTLQALAEARAADGLRVLTISVDRGGARQAGPFLAARGLDRLPVILDQGMRGMRDLGMRGLPTTLLIDRQGRIAAQLAGPADWNGPDAARVLNALLAEPRPEG